MSNVSEIEMNSKTKTRKNCKFFVHQKSGRFLSVLIGILVIGIILIGGCIEKPPATTTSSTTTITPPTTTTSTVSSTTTTIPEKEISEQEALKINISKPQQILPNTFKVTIEINVTNYSISKEDDFDIIKIEGSEEIHADGYPIIPKIGYIYMPLPKSSGNIKLSMVKNVFTTIGYYNIPCHRAISYAEAAQVENPIIRVNCTAKPWPNFTEIYPIPPYWFHISEFDDYKEVAIGSALIQYNPQTKETILYNYIKLELTYQTQITLTITDFSPSKTEYALREPINTSLTVENVGSDTLTGLRAKLVIKDQYGKVRASSLSAPFDVAYGESKTVYVTLSQNLPPQGGYLIEVKVIDDVGNILGGSSEYIGIH